MRPSTTECNDDGTIHRTLSPAMRAVVLAVTALAGDVDMPLSFVASFVPEAAMDWASGSANGLED
jgi:hypothetical protein